jgi:RNA polymerase sigma-70 factor (ECF subfamily)
VSTLRNKQERDGDIPLFNRVYQEHYRPVHAFLVGLGGHDRDTAADLLQETFTRAWSHIADLRDVPEDRRLYWLLRVARNIAADHARRRAVRADIEQALPPGETGTIAPDPAAIAMHRETYNAVDAAIRALPEDLRTVLTMQVMSGLNSTQIGEALGRPAGTVRYQISEARRRITAWLHESEAAPPKKAVASL